MVHLKEAGGMTDVIMKNAMYTIREMKNKDHRSNGDFSEVLPWLSHLKGICRR
jgi:hypothetical protein